MKFKPTLRFKLRASLTPQLAILLHQYSGGWGRRSRLREWRLFSDSFSSPAVWKVSIVRHCSMPMSERWGTSLCPREVQIKDKGRTFIGQVKIMSL